MEHLKDETQMFDTASSGISRFIQTSTLEKAKKPPDQASAHPKMFVEIGF